MPINRQIILGPPGTGKTTKLLDILDSEFAAGTRPNRVAFLSFTRKATEEARTRTMKRFGFSKDELPWFRTIHSLAFNRLGLQRGEVMQTKNYREIGSALGLTFASKLDFEEGLPTGRHKGDRYTFLDGYARARCMSAESAFRTCTNSLDDELDWWEFRRYRQTLGDYKRDRGLVDFADMLEMEQPPLDVDVVIVDEAQDLSTTQYRYLDKVVMPYAKRIYIAGDDDQAIFQWSGADVEAFQTFPGERHVLSLSHRVPQEVHKIARRISSGIRRRYPKEYQPKSMPGLVKWHMDPDSVDLSAPGTWLLLGRNIHLLSNLVAMVRSQGHPYLYRGEPAVDQRHVRAILAWEAQRKGREISKEETDCFLSYLTKRTVSTQTIWHEALTGIPLVDREWYISMLRRGESLTKTPRINISTIHGVKGGEADHVMLLTDMSARTWEGYQQDEDSERRVWYVGATRAKNSLHIVQPQGRMGFQI